MEAPDMRPIMVLAWIGLVVTAPLWLPFYAAAWAADRIADRRERRREAREALDATEQTTDAPQPESGPDRIRRAIETDRGGGSAPPEPVVFAQDAPEGHCHRRCTLCAEKHEKAVHAYRAEFERAERAEAERDRYREVLERIFWHGYDEHVVDIVRVTLDGGDQEGDSHE